MRLLLIVAALALPALVVAAETKTNSKLSQDGEQYQKLTSERVADLQKQLKQPKLSPAQRAALQIELRQQKTILASLAKGKIIAPFFQDFVERWSVSHPGQGPYKPQPGDTFAVYPENVDPQGNLVYTSESMAVQNSRTYNSAGGSETLQRVSSRLESVHGLRAVQQMVTAPQVLNAVKIVGVDPGPHECRKSVFGSLEIITAGIGHCATPAVRPVDGSNGTDRQET